MNTWAVNSGPSGHSHESFPLTTGPHFSTIHWMSGRFIFYSCSGGLDLCSDYSFHWLLSWVVWSPVYHKKCIRTDAYKHECKGNLLTVYWLISFTFTENDRSLSYWLGNWSFIWGDSLGLELSALAKSYHFHCWFEIEFETTLPVVCKCYRMICPSAGFRGHCYPERDSVCANSVPQQLQS